MGSWTPLELNSKRWSAGNIYEGIFGWVGDRPFVWFLGKNGSRSILLWEIVSLLMFFFMSILRRIMGLLSWSVDLLKTLVFSNGLFYFFIYIILSYPFSILYLNLWFKIIYFLKILISKKYSYQNVTFKEIWLSF